MVEKAMILAFTAVSACLPSIATVRIQRKEQDSKQVGILALSGLVALTVVLGALFSEALMYLGIIAMVLMYLYFMLAPMEMI